MGTFRAGGQQTASMVDSAVPRQGHEPRRRPGSSETQTLLGAGSRTRSARHWWASPVASPLRAHLGSQTPQPPRSLTCSGAGDLGFPERWPRPEAPPALRLAPRSGGGAGRRTNVMASGAASAVSCCRWPGGRSAWSEAWGLQWPGVPRAASPLPLVS